MRTAIFVLIGALTASPPVLAASGNVVATANVKARLVSEVSAVAPGQPFWVSLELTIRDGWHTYWRNPGDSGQATSLAWRLPPGFTAGDIVWTTPHRFEIPPLVNYGYAKHAMHLVKITPPADLKVGAQAALAAKASWLVCSDVCIPEDANLELRLPVQAHAATDATDAPLFTAARAEVPTAAPAPVSARVESGRLIIEIGRGWGATLGQIRSLAFFPYDDGGIEYAAPQILKRGSDHLELDMKLGDRPAAAGNVNGVLIATEQSGNESSAVPLEISAPLAGVGAAAAAGAPASANAASEPSASGALPAAAPHSVGYLLLLAILGGLILNLMPCVFPVLSIKALGLVEQAKKHPGEVRTKGIVFALGVIASMLSLAAALLALRAGGEQIGWGFQLQSPIFVTLLMYLLFAVGLNLSGVFEFGGGFAGVGDSLARGDGYRASFFAGVLTTLVATPCTAPYMTVAVGAALTQSAVTALAIFAALGFGLALPYLVLSFAPVARRVMPKPGAWMDTLKQVFAFPIYASAAWLLWVLAAQTSAAGLGAALGGAILIALSAWAYQKSKTAGKVGRAASLATALLAAALAIGLPLPFAGSPAAAGRAGGQSTASADGWQAYDPAELAKLTAAGRPVLVNFTASWCLTCLVNERNAFSDDSVRKTFADRHVVLMKGDWTRRDPVITRALAAFGRAGVPLYVVYNGRPDSPEPVVLPQILTPGIVASAFADASPRTAAR
ncbi:MAG TPA: protein-disulfide reductase DsbD domain-containing protein [Steroidobacteraceae bacterium]|jgi:thiol:disulfide interchange protein DsbD|nr:protein-disulfide reductase DsbD domain-containing protein [Steroidobacteraceae bacterium]